MVCEYDYIRDVKDAVHCIQWGEYKMTAKTQKIVEMIDMLPETEQNLVFELIKRIVIAWDADFSKVTPDERREIDEGDDDIKNGRTVGYDDIDW